MSQVTIYHNPRCGTSRNTLALLRHAGIEPVVVEYLATPPSPQTLRELTVAMGVPVRALLREKEAAYVELKLDDPKRSDDELLEAMHRHPILINRPIVVTERGTKLCRPAEEVLELLPVATIAPFTMSNPARRDAPLPSRPVPNLSSMRVCHPPPHSPSIVPTASSPAATSTASSAPRCSRSSACSTTSCSSIPRTSRTARWSSPPATSPRTCRIAPRWRWPSTTTPPSSRGSPPAPRTA